MQQKFLILGIPPGGLFMARQLRKAWPDSIIYAIGDPKHDIGRYSNTINCFYAASTSEQIIAAVNQAYEDMGKGVVKAYMCSNSMLEFLVGSHPEVFDFLEFENPFEVYQKLVDKVEVDQLCRHLNITRPKEYNLFDITALEKSFPVVIKPLNKSLTIGASKCAYIADAQQLRTYMSKLDALGVDRHSFVCQQCVEGDNRWEYGYGGYFKEGKPLVDICFHQFKQVPQGLCCYSREMTNQTLQQQIKDLVIPLLLRFNYNGFIEFDVKQDANSKVLYLLDVNPRPWRSVDMLVVKLGDSTIFTPSLNDKKVEWHYRYRELYSKKNKKNVSYKVCRRLTGRDSFVSLETLYDPNDREPLRQQRRLDGISLLKKLKK